MKNFKFFMSIFIITSLIKTNAQNNQSIPIDQVTNKITYEEVVSETGTKDELYDRCVKWFNSFYKNITNVTKIQNKLEGRIEGAHRFKIYDFDNKGGKTDAGLVNYSIKIAFKDGKYKYIITDISWKQTSHFPAERWLDKNAPSYSTKYESYLQQTDNEIKKIIDSLKKGMKPEQQKNNEEW